MGVIPIDVAAELRDRLGLQRAVETGTFEGRGTRLLAREFPKVVSIELSESLYLAAKANLADLRNVQLMQGNSGEQLRAVAEEGIPTLYWLDGHWCARDNGLPAGIEHQCPVLDEISAISGAHPSDCVFIDDAVYFAASPPPPYRATQWPTLTQLLDAIRDALPKHHVTVLHNYVIAVPLEGKRSLDVFGHRALARKPSQRVLGRLRGLTKRWTHARRELPR